MNLVRNFPKHGVRLKSLCRFFFRACWKHVIQIKPFGINCSIIFFLCVCVCVCGRFTLASCSNPRLFSKFLVQGLCIASHQCYYYFYQEFWVMQSYTLPHLWVCHPCGLQPYNLEKLLQAYKVCIFTLCTSPCGWKSLSQPQGFYEKWNFQKSVKKITK